MHSTKRLACRTGHGWFKIGGLTGMTSKTSGPAAASKDGPEPAFRERLRANILAIALRTISQEGLAALQARRIAVEAQCSVGTIYNIFGDLDGLIIAANSDTLALMDAELRHAYEATQGLPAPARLTELALSYMRFAYANRLAWSAIFEHRMPAGKDLPEDYDTSRAQLLALLAQAIGDGTMAPELRLRAARSLFAATHGIIALALNNKLSPFDPTAVEADIRFIVTAAARGLADAT
jgi:AcrR family transcriptional regulator